MTGGASCSSSCLVAAFVVAAFVVDADVFAAGKGQAGKRSETANAVRALPDPYGVLDSRAIGATAPERTQPPPLLSRPNAGGPLAVPGSPLAGIFGGNGSKHTGPEYRFESGWSLHAGINDDSREPGFGRRRPSAGLGYRPSDNWNVDFGYVHPYNDGLRGLEPVAPGGSAIGKPGGMHELLGVAGRVRF